MSSEKITFYKSQIDDQLHAICEHQRTLSDQRIKMEKTNEKLREQESLTKKYKIDYDRLHERCKTLEVQTTTIFIQTSYIYINIILESSCTISKSNCKFSI